MADTPSNPDEKEKTGEFFRDRFNETAEEVEKIPEETEKSVQ